MVCSRVVYLAAAGEAAVGTFLSAPDVAVAGPAYVEFLAMYEEIYGEPPRAPFHAPAHDAAMMIFAAIERAAVQLDDGTLLVGRQALLDATVRHQEPGRSYRRPVLHPEWGLWESLDCNLRDRES